VLVVINAPNPPWRVALYVRRDAGGERGDVRRHPSQRRWMPAAARWVRVRVHATEGHPVIATVTCLGLRILGLGFRVWGLGFRVQGHAGSSRRGSQLYGDEWAGQEGGCGKGVGCGRGYTGTLRANSQSPASESALVRQPQARQ